MEYCFDGGTKIFLGFEELVNKEKRERFETKDCSFEYVIYSVKEHKYAEIYNFYTTNTVINFPTTILSVPILYISVSSKMEERGKDIKKLVIGGNIIHINRITKCLINLESIEITNNYDGLKESVLNFVRLSKYSKNDVSLLIPNKYDLMVKNKCVLSNDGKELFFWIGKKEKLIIPDTVETIHTSAISNGLRITDEIIWPKNLIKIEDRAITMSSLDFFKQHQYPKTLQYAGDCCFLSCLNNPERAPIYVKNGELFISNNIEELSDGLVFKIIANKVSPTKNFVYKNGLLLSKDGKILYAAISEYNAETEIIIPATVNKVSKHAFKNKRKLKRIFIHDPSLIESCIFSESDQQVSIVTNKPKKTINKGNQSYSKDEVRESISYYYSFLEKNGLLELFEVLDKYVLLIRDKKGNLYEDFDTFTKELKRNFKSIRLNFTNLRNDLNSQKNPCEFVDVEFKSCFDDINLLEFVWEMLIKNGVIACGKDFNDTISSQSLFEYINSDDFDGADSEPTSEIFIIHHNEMGRNALLICDMSNIPSKFIGDYLICKSTHAKYYIQIINYC